MSCDYCKKDSDYMFQDGERICKSCLVKYPDNRKDYLKLMTEIKDAWEDLIGNSEEVDAFGNVTIAEIDYDAFTKIVRSL